MLVEFEQSGGIGVLRLRRPESANALNGEILRQIHKLQLSLRRDRRVRVVITIGEGKGFCAGSDLREQGKLTPLQAEKSQLLEAKVCREFLRLPQPTIAGVHGYALGGGLCLAMHHDFQIVAADARLGLPEVKLGWNPTFGIERLCHLVGLGVANRWLMLGAEISATEAVSQGCITQVVPAGEDVLATCGRFAETLLEIPAGGLAAIKQSLWATHGSQLIRGDRRDARLYRKCLVSAEARASTGKYNKGGK
jgi:enoyl-CoA hydratase/carnithine racemase